MNTATTSSAEAEVHGLPQHNHNELSGDLLWGVSDISKAINRTPRQTFHLLETRALPALKVGRRWCATRSGLARFFGGEAV
jgi:hypothetical protein